MKCETRHHKHRWLVGRTWLGLWIAQLAVVGVVAIASAQRGTRALVNQSIASGAATAAPVLPDVALAPATNRSVKVTLAWDASPDHGSVSNYAIWFGSISKTYTNAVNAGTNLSVTISNLLANTRYYFAASAVSKIGVTSALSAEIFWPVPFTNYIGVGIKTNGRVIVQVLYTNPPGDVVLFEPFIWQTNNQVSVIRLPSGNLIVGNTNTP